MESLTIDCLCQRMPNNGLEGSSVENACSLKHVVQGEQAATPAYVRRNSACFTVDQLRNERSFSVLS